MNGKVLLVGDSYCMAMNYGDTVGEFPDYGWGKLYADMANIDNYDLICRSGTGIVAKNGDKDFQAMIDDYAAAHTDNDDVTMVIINGGYNDRSSTYDEIMIKGEQLFNDARKLFPNATFFLGMNGWNDHDEEIQAQIANISYPAYYDLADYLGEDVVYMVGAESVLKDAEEPVFTALDGFHPNLNGQNRLASFVQEFINQYEREKLLRAVSEPQEKVTAEVSQTTLAVTLIVALVVGTGIVGGIRLILAKKK